MNNKTHYTSTVSTFLWCYAYPSPAPLGPHIQGFILVPVALELSASLVLCQEEDDVHTDGLFFLTLASTQWINWRNHCCSHARWNKAADSSGRVHTRHTWQASIPRPECKTKAVQNGSGSSTLQGSTLAPYTQLEQHLHEVWRRHRAKQLQPTHMISQGWRLQGISPQHKFDAHTRAEELTGQ